MDRFDRKSFTLGEDTFFVQLIPPKESMKAWTELQKILMPAISGAMEGAKLEFSTEQEKWFNTVASALQTLPYTLDESKMEVLYRYLLNPEYVAVQRKQDKTPIRLTEDVIDEIFTGRIFDLFYVMAKVIQINYMDFSKLSSVPIGFRQSAEQIRGKITESLESISRM